MTRELTSFSEHGGCGCKIAPGKLAHILERLNEPADDASSQLTDDPASLSSLATSSISLSPSGRRFMAANVLVDGTSRDDAAVIALSDSQALISTTDFFTPIVDDAYDYGKIAACNALSDVYAMGGRPLTALSILAWPPELGPEIAARVIQGASDCCDEAGIRITGGHSIINSCPIFGLSVNGIVDIKNIKRNGAGASAGCILSLTKPLGVGLYAAARRVPGLLSENDWFLALHAMTTLNTVGVRLGYEARVQLLTDVTGFGLLGHLREVCDASGLCAEIDVSKLSVLPKCRDLALQAGIETGAGKRNCQETRRAVEKGQIVLLNAEADQRFWDVLLNDPQTSGPLLVGSDASILDILPLGSVEIGRLFSA